MCGIAGAIGAVDDTVVEAVRQMSAAQVHRGPDSSGLWISRPSDARVGAVLALRRLAIIDLSEDGRQPMTDPETGNVVVFNGEIYNFGALRRELEQCGARFRSRSDTEVILKAYARWGAESLSRLRGMFAFALWDARRSTLLLARDRLGIKPLYLCSVGWPGGSRTLLFASEVRALLASGLIEREIDPVALASYVWNGYVIGPTTIVRGVELLPAATSAIATQDGALPASRRYWHLPAASFPPGRKEEVREQLSAAVSMHLISDVPLGIFLSGGIDSSAIAALAVRSGSAHVRTFNIGFDEAAFDESRHARAVASALGTEHHETRLSKDTFRQQLPDALASLDQPTFDGINTYFVSRAVREAGLTVALAGTGGDELFGGYYSFRDVPWAAAWSHRFSAFPPELLRRLANSLTRVAAFRSAMPAQTRWGKLGDALAARGELLDTYQVTYALFSSDFARQLLKLDVDGALYMGLPTDVARELRQSIAGSRPLAAVSTLALWCFLGERLLRDTDAASMAASLEVRVPFLDHEVVAAAAALDDTDRFQPLGKKQLLRDIALKDVDPALFDRPKSGFVLPIDRWARDVLKDEMTTALRDPSFCEAAGLDAGAVGRLWSAFLKRAPGLYWSRVWAVYVLGWWCRQHRMSVH
ncbi:MAG TPA: asparagine synthase (glutamine-hydrolyzing) [Candidatus Limnocylindria bacterium]|jgi:asparagine synthase (glutamine-hydrolysing)|nr:asparagine synthase (glutamine-hydrolyzing) [Candidatus Limnocylindria bacterium]